jgi:hypothetical protein
MRLLMLESTCVVRCSSKGRPFISSQVIRFLAVLQQQLSLIPAGLARTQGNIRPKSGVPLCWLRGPQPGLVAGQVHSKVAAQRGAVRTGGRGRATPVHWGRAGVMGLGGQCPEVW